MVENGALVKFLFAGREIVAETEADGNVIRYIRGYDLISSDSENAKTYYHYACDEQGSITHLVSGVEKVVVSNIATGVLMQAQWQISKVQAYQLMNKV